MPLLEKQGHTVIAPDLPSHGRDKTPLPAVSFQAYVDKVCTVIDARREPVVLVGHSMGGGIITQVAEYRPDKIKTLVYLTALLPQNGETLTSLFQQDTESFLSLNVEVTADQSTMMVREGALKEAFYADCAEEDITLAKLLLVPQALAPGGVPLETTAANFGRVPRVYIECLRDRALTPPFQKKLYTTLPCQKVISMNTSHSPFFSVPGELAAHLASA